MSDVWVLNASPIITLAKVAQLSLLERIATELLVPEEVATEILVGPPTDPARLALETGWGQTSVTRQHPADFAGMGSRCR
ncbi:MAG TPA: hypothetical protein VMW56_07700 [Candidatus Margulisiibacteriota bacterium]|nr:hypothetical protein [Candidatus Margulisiibacteriota bacterium]